MMAATIDTLRAHGVLSPLDQHFALTVARLAGEQQPEVLLAAALLSRQVGNGHACFDVRRWAEQAPLLDADGEPLPVQSWPNGERWLAALRKSALVDDGSTPVPLVLDHRGRLYLRRYWEHEQRLANAIRARVTAVDPDVCVETLRRGLARLFRGPHRDPADGPDRQRMAAALAVRRRLCVISGGPGTGKTFTVAKILALVVEQALAGGARPPRITLLAPTGKAAMRLGEAIRQTKAGLECAEAVRQAIPDVAATIHRGLGSVRGSLTEFRHDAQRPLLTDVVVVDEASMVDLALMSRLLQAVPPQARLILLGDKDQLASVEAGAVLGDICNSGRPHRYSRGVATWLQEVTGEPIAAEADAPVTTGIWDCIVYLTRSYRYDAASALGTLAAAINAGDAAAALAAVEGGVDVRRLEPPPDGGVHPALRAAIVRGFEPFCRAVEGLARLRALEHFRVLCAHRHGPGAVEDLNLAAEKELARAGLLRPAPRTYAGRPIIVTRNDYQVGVFNGDVGVILDTPEDENQHTACFVGAEGKERRLAASRLPPHETVFAMSIHKSQGSEFDEVAVVLPPRVSPVLSRELLYTAVTRARRAVTIHASRAILEEAIRLRIERDSGLRDALWGEDSA